MNNNVKVLDMTGKETGEITVDSSVLELEKGTQAVKDTVVSFLNSLRAGTACTKSKGQVRGGGAKPWRQKGTGRARSGSNRSPIWRGGGVVFGPQANRNYTKKVNKKVRRLALSRAFSERLDAGDVIVVDDIKLDAPKTKLANAFFKSINCGDDVLVLVDEYDMNFDLAASNIAKIGVLRSDVVNVYQMLAFKKVVITKAGLDVLVKRLKGEKIYE